LPVVHRERCVVVIDTAADIEVNVTVCDG